MRVQRQLNTIYVVFASMYVATIVWSHSPTTIAALKKSSAVDFQWIAERSAAADLQVVQPVWKLSVAKSSEISKRIVSLLNPVREPQQKRSVPLRRSNPRREQLLASNARPQPPAKPSSLSTSTAVQPSIPPQPASHPKQDEEGSLFRLQPPRANISPNMPLPEIRKLPEATGPASSVSAAPDTRTASLGPGQDFSTTVDPAPSFHTPVSSPMGLASIAVPPPPGFVSFCLRFPTQCPTTANSADKVSVTPDNWATLVHVNETVNDSIIPEKDERHYGRAEYWTIPTDGFGNCHDYALAKRKLLIDAGLPVLALRLAIVVVPAGARHAVLTIATNRGDYVLDNLDSEIRPWAETQYTWIERQSAKSAWDWVALDSALISQNLKHAPRGRRTSRRDLPHAG